MIEKFRGNYEAHVGGQTLFDTKMMPSTESASDFLSSMLEASTEYSIIGQDLDGGIVLWNEGARRMYGYERSEMVGKLNSRVLHTAEKIAHKYPAEMRRIALAEGKWQGTMTRVRKDGTDFVATAALTPRLGADGEAVGFLMISKDISDDIQRRRKFEETQFYTRSLFESNIDALMTTDLLGIITDVNEQMQRLTGHDRDELIGSRFKNYFTDPDVAEAGIRLVLREGSVTNYELTAKARDGQPTVVSYNASTFCDASGRLQGVFAAARDLTEQ
jgi:PAS domain S-box-containing protein